MDKQIILIGGGGVGKSMLRRALMALQLRQLLTVVDVDELKHKQTEINAVFLDDLVPPKRQVIQKAGYRDFSDIQRRNKSDRKRNRANRWR